jgi:hypothetical protein
MGVQKKILDNKAALALNTANAYHQMSDLPY